jgi:hypothetical protein
MVVATPSEEVRYPATAGNAILGNLETGALLDNF